MTSKQFEIWKIIQQHAGNKEVLASLLYIGEKWTSRRIGGLISERKHPILRDLKEFAQGNQKGIFSIRDFHTWRCNKYATVAGDNLYYNYAWLNAYPISFNKTVLYFAKKALYQGWLKATLNGHTIMFKYRGTKGGKI